MPVIVGGMSVRDGVSVGVTDGVFVGVRVAVDVGVTDGVIVNVAVGETVTVGVDVAVTVGSGLGVSAVDSPPVFGIRNSDSDAVRSGCDALQIRFGTLKAPMAVARRIAQIK